MRCRPVVKMTDGPGSYAEFLAVPWEAGNLTALAKDKAGQTVASTSRITNGHASKLTLTLDAPSRLTGTGESVVSTFVSLSISVSRYVSVPVYLSLHIPFHQSCTVSAYLRFTTSCLCLTICLTIFHSVSAMCVISLSLSISVSLRAISPPAVLQVRHCFWMVTTLHCSGLLWWTPQVTGWC